MIVFLLFVIVACMLFGPEGVWALFAFAFKAALVLMGVGLLVLLVVASQH